MTSWVKLAASLVKFYKHCAHRTCARFPSNDMSWNSAGMGHMCLLLWATKHVESTCTVIVRIESNPAASVLKLTTLVDVGPISIRKWSFRMDIGRRSAQKIVLATQSYFNYSEVEVDPSRLPGCMRMAIANGGLILCVQCRFLSLI